MGNFHTGTVANADLIKVTDEKVELTVTWNGNKETFVLNLD